MRDQERWIGLLKETGALVSGHFRLSSGWHSPQYVQCARLLETPRIAGRAGAALAAALPGDIDRIASPPLGALLIGYEVARALGTPFVFPERGADGALVFRRGFAIERGERIAVVEDVITTGRTTEELLELLERHGAEIVGLAAIVDRSSANELRGRRIASLVRMSIPAYKASECPQCAEGLPSVKPGSRPERKER